LRSQHGDSDRGAEVGVKLGAVAVAVAFRILDDIAIDTAGQNFCGSDLIQNRAG